MQALATQFDDRRLSNAVATPTCSSCCCCCCCLATSIAASTLLAKRVSKEGKKYQVPGRHFLTLIAALFIPFVGLLDAILFAIVTTVTRECTERVYESSSRLSPQIDTVCSGTDFAAGAAVTFIVPVLVLWFLYTRVHIERPLKRALLVTLLIVVAGAAEAAAAIAMIFTGVGILIYLILIPVFVGIITAWYYRHLGRESQPSPAELTALRTAYNAPAPAQHETTQPPITPEPPQPQPPAPSGQ